MTYAPDTLTRTTEWTVRAACVGYLSLFEREDNTSLEKARTICATCPLRPRCLTDAMAEEGHSDEWRRAGVRGGLTPNERARLARRIRSAADGQTVPLTAEPQPHARNPHDVLEGRSIHLGGGHREWQGSMPVAVNGVSYTPRQLAWVVAHGEKPAGRLQKLCAHKGCIAAEHMKDPGPPVTGCGTRNGYLAHRRAGEDACQPCKDANASGDRRLQLTGSTKPLKEPCHA